MKPKSAKAAMTKARNFPTNTCPASRHAQQIAETLLGAGPTWHVTDDRRHSGESIAATVTALWEARDEITRLQAKLVTQQARHMSDDQIAEFGALCVANRRLKLTARELLREYKQDRGIAA